MNKIFIFTENVFTENSLPSEEFSEFVYFQTNRPFFASHLSPSELPKTTFAAYDNPLSPATKILKEKFPVTFWPYPLLVHKEELPFHSKRPPTFFLDFYKQTLNEILFTPKQFTRKEVPYPENFKVLQNSEDFRDKMFFYLKTLGMLPRHFAEHFFSERKKFIKDLLLRDWLILRLFYGEPIKEIFTENKKITGLFWQAKTGFPLIDAMIIALHSEGFLKYSHLKILISFFHKLLQLPTQIGWEGYRKLSVFTETAWEKGLWYYYSELLEPPKPKKRFVFDYPSISRKADPNADFIKRYIPELRKEPPMKIHRLQSTKYFPPCVNYVERIAKFNAMYRGRCR